MHEYPKTMHDVSKSEEEKCPECPECPVCAPRRNEAARPDRPCSWPTGAELLSRLRKNGGTFANLWTADRLDTIRAANSTRARQHALHDLIDVEVLAGVSGIEGHSGSSVEATVLHLGIAGAARPRVICEVGFNAGHSMATWITASDPCEVRVYAFDIGIHHYYRAAAALYGALLPGRFEFIVGDSRTTLPQFYERVGGDTWKYKCDLFHVDGGHSPGIPQSDSDYAVRLTNAGGIVIADDTPCDKSHCVEPRIAFEAQVNGGNLVGPVTVHNTAIGHGISFAHVAEDAKFKSVKF